MDMTRREAARLFMRAFIIFNLLTMAGCVVSGVWRALVK